MGWGPHPWKGGLKKIFGKKQLFKKNVKKLVKFRSSVSDRENRDGGSYPQKGCNKIKKYIKSTKIR